MGECGSAGRGFGPTFSFVSPSRKIGPADASEETNGFRGIESVEDRDAMVLSELRPR